jgi:UDP-glucose 4-epimerase
VKVLVTGGAGYVGSTTSERLIDAGHEVVVVDSLFRGYREAIPPEAEFVQGDIGDAALVERTLRDHGVEAVLHCAGRALVGESVTQPELYYLDNVVSSQHMLDAMRAAGVRRIVFSSSAAVYGAPETSPIPEDHAMRPVNPYGETKRAFEGMLDWYSRAHDIAAVSLRYFNVCGATDERGEDHRPETHLIPNLLASVRGGPPLQIFGDDYPTRDGTCIRDYIHVDDLAAAHAAALELTADVGAHHVACNLGSGSGFSVQEVVAAAEAVVGLEVPRVTVGRREGDPPVLVASNDKAREVLGWKPERGSLDDMIGSAWRWRQQHPDGYGERPAGGAG